MDITKNIDRIASGFREILHYRNDILEYAPGSIRDKLVRTIVVNGDPDAGEPTSGSLNYKPATKPILYIDCLVRKIIIRFENPMIWIFITDVADFMNSIAGRSGFREIANSKAHVIIARSSDFDVLIKARDDKAPTTDGILFSWPLDRSTLPPVAFWENRYDLSNDMRNLIMSTDTHKIDRNVIRICDVDNVTNNDTGNNITNTTGVTLTVECSLSLRKVREEFIEILTRSGREDLRALDLCEHRSIADYHKALGTVLLKQFMADNVGG